jgi:hypothetical protein
MKEVSKTEGDKGNVTTKCHMWIWMHYIKNITSIRGEHW